MPTRRYVVRGRVQAVGFREHARGVAERLGVTGWVRNLPDGRSVEAVAIGHEPALASFEAAIRRGPGGAMVSEFVTEDYPHTEMGSFEIRS